MSTSAVASSMFCQICKEGMSAGQGVEVLGSIYHRACVAKTLSSAQRCDVCNGTIMAGKGVSANGMRYHKVCVDALIRDCNAVTKVAKKTDQAAQGEFDGMFFP